MESQYSTRFPDMPPPVWKQYFERNLSVSDQAKWEIPDKVVIKAAVTGVLVDRQQNPYQPYSTKEIRDEAIRCIEAGACSIHVHVRDEKGNATTERKYYGEIINPIREKYGRKVHFDGETGIGVTFEDAMMPITEGWLESSAVNTTATYVGDWPFITPPQVMQAQTKVIQEHNRKAQIAAYNLGDIDNAYRYLIKPGIIKQPYEWLLVPGTAGCMPMPNERAMCEGLLIFINRIREIDPAKNPFIMVCSGGRASSYITALSILLGLHVRVGMEDTVWVYPHKEEIMRSNAEVVKSAVEIARQLGRVPATADDYRKLVGLK